jgi:hypothetical protein
MLRRSRFRDAIHRAEPRLRLHHWEWNSLWAYPLSGGFRSWQLIPSVMVGPLLRLERTCLPVLGRWAAFRLLIVLERCSEEPTPT